MLLIGAALVERDRRNILSVTFQTLSVSRFPDGHMKYIRWIYETFHLECEVTLFSLCYCGMQYRADRYDTCIITEHLAGISPAVCRQLECLNNGPLDPVTLL